MFLSYNKLAETISSFENIENMLDALAFLLDGTPMYAEELYNSLGLSERAIFDFNYFLHNLFSVENIIYMEHLSISRYAYQRIDINNYKPKETADRFISTVKSNSLYMLGDIKINSLPNSMNYTHEMTINYDSMSLSDKNNLAFYNKLVRTQTINNILKVL